MNKFLVAAVMISAITALDLCPQLALARSCLAVAATARGVTQGIATTKAQWRLNRYVRHNLSGARMGHAATNCQGWGAGKGVRPSCERSAIVCS
jgi:hypothetical protein